MKLSKLNILTLDSIKGVGNVAILKIGEYVKDHGMDISSSKDLLNACLEAKAKKVKGERWSLPKDLNLAAIEAAASNAEWLIEKNENAGIGITTFYEADFPELLRHTVSEEGKEANPIILYYKGDLSITKDPGLAVIGTREPTANGVKAGMYLSSKFAQLGFNIVSGLAIGCDTSGHKGALSVGGKTTAFLAHGLDSVYPKENEGLAQEIVDKGGLLMSEYPVGTMINRYNLVARDRLQAALSLATLVIQTGVHGGTMHAVNATFAANKPVFAVHYQDAETNEAEKSQGNAYLVNEKGARYIKGDDDLASIAEEIKQSYKPIKTNKSVEQSLF